MTAEGGAEGRALEYRGGFGNEFATEAIPGALPVGQNSPQRVPFGLYAEQVSGTAFTAPRHLNRRSWLYRIQPTAALGPYHAVDGGPFPGTSFDALPATPNPLRWDPPPMPSAPTDLVAGLTAWAACGDPSRQEGAALYLYAANASMEATVFHDADGELLFVPQQGRLRLATELGILEAGPGEVVLVPRGIKFRAGLPDGTARGYACENFGAPFRLPELGPIGANGLANARDFLHPVAAFEDRAGPFRSLAKFQGRLHEAALSHSPLDVVAWHGNLAPCKYDLSRFNAMGAVGFDHPDPSIFTVLTSPSHLPGTADCDFVIFPERWQVAEHTFRPPWFHRNVMSEFMGLVRGAYDAKAGGFVPGGASLHNASAGHGPDADTFARASADELVPRYLADTLAFMFETRRVLRPTPEALRSPALQADYHLCWRGLPRAFRRP